MTRRGWCVTCALLGPLCSGPAAAQASGALDIVGTVIEYDGYLVSGAGALSPSFRYDAAGFSVGGQGTWLTFESGSEIILGNLAAGWLGPARGAWRIEAAGSMGLAKYTESDGNGHLLVRTRMHYVSDRVGGWAGISTGLTVAGNGAVPLEIAAGVWHARDRWALVGSATASWIDQERYLDLVGAARWTGERTALDLRIGARPLSSVTGNAVGAPRTEAYAEALARITLTDRLEALLAAGRSPGDPIRNTLSSSYLSAGIRIHLQREPAPTLPIVARALELSARTIRESPDGSAAQVSISPDGRVRVLIEGVTSVEIMADFTDWEPIALTRETSGWWELTDRLPPGAYRLNIRVNGGPWAVPLGTRLERDEFGGAVGVIVIH